MEGTLNAGAGGGMMKLGRETRKIGGEIKEEVHRHPLEDFNLEGEILRYLGKLRKSLNRLSGSRAIFSIVITPSAICKSPCTS